MYEFIEDVLKEATEDMKSTVPTPMAANLFEIDDELPLLDNDKTD